VSDPRTTPIRELAITTATQAFLEQLGVATVADVLACPVMRAHPFVLEDLADALARLGVPYGGRLDPVPLEIPPDRRLPSLRVTYQPGGDGEPCSRLGGEPSAWEGSAPWPACARCARKLVFLAQLCGPLDLGTWRLDRGAGIQLFSCLGEPWECPTYDDASGASVAFYRPALRAFARAAEAPSGEPHRMVLTPAWDDSILLATAEEFLTPAKLEALRAAPRPRRDPAAEVEKDLAFMDAMTEKLGGVLAVANPPEPARCPQCDGALVFLAQLGRDSIVPNPSGDATWIVRACPEWHTVRLGWTR
jgi:hypothetical protein